MGFREAIGKQLKRERIAREMDARINRIARAQRELKELAMESAALEDSSSEVEDNGGPSRNYNKGTRAKRLKAKEARRAKRGKAARKRARDVEKTAEKQRKTKRRQSKRHNPSSDGVSSDDDSRSRASLGLDSDLADVCEDIFGDATATPADAEVSPTEAGDPPINTEEMAGNGTSGTYFSEADCAAIISVIARMGTTDAAGSGSSSSNSAPATRE